MGKRSTRWLQFVVLAIAAFASIATSKKRGWILEADVANDAPGKARIAFVDASQEPDLTLDNGVRAEPRGGYYTGMWSGTARYLIPADRKLVSATIDGPCGGGCNARSGCEPPAGEYVKVLSIKPVETWQREVVTPEVTEDLEFHRTTIPLVTSHRGRLELRAKGRGGRAYVVDDKILIDWEGYPEGPIKTTWSLRVTLEDVCPGEAPCEAPPTSKLELGKATLAKRPRY